MADLDLARRAVAATGWRVPTPTVTDSIGGRLTYRERSGVLWVDVAPFGPDAEWLPDLDDGATAGCVDALMRERWGAGFEVMPYATHICDHGVYEPAPVIWYRLERIGMDPWCSLTHAPVMHPDHPNRYLAGPTRVAALVAALEVPRG
jgi:hypothetical protein